MEGKKYQVFTAGDQATLENVVPQIDSQSDVRILLCEPLAESLDLVGSRTGPDAVLHRVNLLEHIHWVVIAGDISRSMPKFCDITWVRSIICQCKTNHVPVYLKGIGTQNNWTINMAGASWRGDNPNEWPSDLRVREIPEFIGEQTAMRIIKDSQLHDRGSPVTD